MLTVGLLSLLAATIPALAQDTSGPVVLDPVHNATNIEGTWTTGSGAVLTGPVSPTSAFALESALAERLLSELCKSCQYEYQLSKNYWAILFIVGSNLGHFFGSNR